MDSISASCVNWCQLNDSEVSPNFGDGRDQAVAARRERTLDDVRRSQMLPMLGRKIVEGEQRLAILDQAFDRLVVFDTPSFDEGVECCERIFLGLSHPDFLERPLGFRVLALR